MARLQAARRTGASDADIKRACRKRAALDVNPDEGCAGEFKNQRRLRGAQ